MTCLLPHWPARRRRGLLPGPFAEGGDVRMPAFERAEPAKHPVQIAAGNRV